MIAKLARDNMRRALHSYETLCMSLASSPLVVRVRFFIQCAVAFERFASVTSYVPTWCSGQPYMKWAASDLILMALI
jgi:hypothetical protein